MAKELLRIIPNGNLVLGRFTSITNASAELIGETLTSTPDEMYEKLQKEGIFQKIVDLCFIMIFSEVEKHNSKIRKSAKTVDYTLNFHDSETINTSEAKKWKLRLEETFDKAYEKLMEEKNYNSAYELANLMIEREVDLRNKKASELFNEKDTTISTTKINTPSANKWKQRINKAAELGNIENKLEEVA